LFHKIAASETLKGNPIFGRDSLLDIYLEKFSGYPEGYIDESFADMLRRNEADLALLFENVSRLADMPDRDGEYYDLFHKIAANKTLKCNPLLFPGKKYLLDVYFEKFIDKPLDIDAEFIYMLCKNGVIATQKSKDKDEKPSLIPPREFIEDKDEEPSFTPPHELTDTEHAEMVHKDWGPITSEVTQESEGKSGKAKDDPTPSEASTRESTGTSSPTTSVETDSSSGMIVHAFEQARAMVAYDAPERLGSPEPEVERHIPERPASPGPFGSRHR
jgi:hypothetical protein